jgi:hypothetical protein
VVAASATISRATVAARARDGEAIVALELAEGHQLIAVCTTTAEPSDAGARPGASASAAPS